ncbi:MAG: tetraacyldisaccharide 4'-kinase [Desulfobacteraceae bacterium]|nr:MAG: tetraacyldisaccharide 4'-kinase [Desulfobacteraceae bacterium]
MRHFPAGKRSNMNTLKRKMESIMNDNGLPKGIPDRFLWGISRCYGHVMKLRDRYYRQSPERSGKLPCMVISIGNITVGGTGKTPMTVYLATMLQRSGYRVAIVSRGYGGKASRTGGVVCDGKNILMDARMAGDEPYMMAGRLQDVPIVVGSRRYEAGMLAMERFSPDIILLDDGFQHRKVKRDLDILLLDAARPFGNGHLLPRGTLREPVEMIRRADIMVLTRAGNLAEPETPFRKQLSQNHLEEVAANTPLFISSHEPYLYSIHAADGQEDAGDKPSSLPNPSLLKGKSVFTFSGIAKNQDFQTSVTNLGCRIVGTLAFPDHHDYHDHDFSAIIQAARKSNAEMLVTTEKDDSRMAGRFPFPLPLAVIGVTMTIREEKAFQNLIISRLTETA